LDLRFVDLEMTHLDDRDALARLRSEVVLPARASGVSVWLGGISLGGLAALDYASVHSGEIDGLCLLAPYLGNRMLINEIAAASGVSGWEPGRLAEFDAERRIWRYIKTRADSRPVFLGYGREDRFSVAHDLMAAVLPANRVDVIAGGHEWPTWLKLWENFLDSHFA
jgi:pimeloyl-ACP methyl ester carboxylesterase